jgi:hypothetical protein
MPSWLDALGNLFDNIRDSGIIRDLTEATIGNFVRRRAPDIYPDVMADIHRVMDYIESYLRRRSY